MVEHGFMGKPENIYNIDEKGCRLTLHHTQEVLAAKGTKRLHLIAPEHGENTSITIVACCNAVGQAIPPMILFKGKRRRPEWGDDMPPGTAIKMTEKGSMTCQVFIKWLTHFAKFKSVGKFLLIFDGAKSHLDANIVDVADEHDIILFCLSSDCTHELQPLDKAVFVPFEQYWDPAVLGYWSNHGERTITKARFGRIFSDVWLKSMTPNNIMSGFRATGICSFNPEVITDSAFAPSDLYFLQPSKKDREGIESDEESDCNSELCNSSVTECANDSGAPVNDERLSTSFTEILTYPNLRRKRSQDVPL
ncbi:uncharacterized protein [Periplaneta americana]|uniref:uncharacterized protein isoform X2 n=1 Tax=Periplaneta americana TaxID=6978 RepID=UPI0037E899D0